MNGFDPGELPSFLYDFQEKVTRWELEKGRGAIFADCGLGKTPMALAWADKVLKKTNKPILSITPLAVSHQTVREGEKFGIECRVTKTGDVHAGINVTNYHRLHYYNPDDFGGVILDESGILKNFAGKVRQQITEFMNSTEFRLLCTATPAPNDHMELGTSSEALGELRRVEMLSMFFIHDAAKTQQWRLKKHAIDKFWEWMAGWCRAFRKPSDLGFDDTMFILPKMHMTQHTVKSTPMPGNLLVTEAIGLNEQRAARRASIAQRVEVVAELANNSTRPFIAWCDLNDESTALAKAIPDAVEVRGSQTDDYKERTMIDFSDGNIRVLVTKAKIAGHGMNWQHCSDMSYFPSHSHEAFYQSSRRIWRFGQKREVNCHMVTSEAETNVLANMQRKEAIAIEMFKGLVRHMRKFQVNETNRAEYLANIKQEIPSWLK